MMWSDPIERTLLQLREALAVIQRGNDVSFSTLDRMIVEALRTREVEMRTNTLSHP